MNNKKIMSKIIASSLVFVIGAVNVSEVFAYTKDETVYSKVKSNGENYQTTVTEHIKNTDDINTLNDISELLNITNTNGNEKFSKENNSITWNAYGNDIYYKGNTEKEIPIQTSINYELDGKEIEAKDLAGKKVKFDVTINEIKTRVLPELNEDFFKDLGYEDMKSVDELKEEIKHHLLHEKEHAADDKFIDECLEKAAGNMTVKINEEIIHEEVHRMMHQYAEQLKMQGMDLNTYYQITNTKEEDLHKQMEPEAEKRIKYRYLLETIAEENKVDFTEKEVDAKAKEIAENYGITTEELLKAYGSLEVVKYDMKMHKALEILKESNEKKATK